MSFWVSFPIKKKIDLRIIEIHCQQLIQSTLIQHQNESYLLFLTKVNPSLLNLGDWPENQAKTTIQSKSPELAGPIKMVWVLTLKKYRGGLFSIEGNGAAQEAVVLGLNHTWNLELSADKVVQCRILQAFYFEGKVLIWRKRKKFGGYSN